MSKDFSEQIAICADYSVRQAVELINKSEIEDANFNVYFLAALEIAMVNLMVSCEKNGLNLSNLPMSTAFIAGIYFSAAHTNDSINLGNIFIDTQVYNLFAELSNAVYCDTKVYCDTVNVLKGIDNV